MTEQFASIIEAISLKASCWLMGYQLVHRCMDSEIASRYIAKTKIEPAVYEQIMGHSIRMAQEIYRTTNDADLQNNLGDEAPLNHSLSRKMLYLP